MSTTPKLFIRFTKNLLEYSDDYGRSVAKNSFWYSDRDATSANTNAGFQAKKLLTQAAADNALGAGGKHVKVRIPFNRYSFFEELEDRMLVPMQLQFEIELNSDNELIHKAARAAAGRVVVNRFNL